MKVLWKIKCFNVLYKNEFYPLLYQKNKKFTEDICSKIKNFKEKKKPHRKKREKANTILKEAQSYSKKWHK